jgi:Zn-dependent protease with chaperone function
MFVLRGIAVSLTFFVLFYCVLSALVAATWRSLRWLHAGEKDISRLLFALRVLPLLASVMATLVFVVPSFQLLEPRSVDEGMGATPLALGICALVLIACGSFRVVTAQTKTSRIVARWLESAKPLGTTASSIQNVAYCSQVWTPPLTLVGVHKPKVLVSKSTLLVLSGDELEISLKHELAHISSRDNLKKLVFRFCPFPGMSALENAWSQAAELAADDAAVSNQDDAINLAAALVKLSRIIPVEPAPVCTVGFVTGSIQARVTRLLAWECTDKVNPQTSLGWFAILAALIAGLCIVATYGPVLTLTHEVTEWLVR